MDGPYTHPVAYQKFVNGMWRNHHDHYDKQLAIANAGLCGESGEVSELVKKKLADNLEYPSEKMGKELGDVAFYLAQMCTLHGLSLGEVFEANAVKLQSRAARGTLVGNGSDR